MIDLEIISTGNQTGSLGGAQIDDITSRIGEGVDILIADSDLSRFSGEWVNLSKSILEIGNNGLRQSLQGSLSTDFLKYSSDARKTLAIAVLLNSSGTHWGYVFDNISGEQLFSDLLLFYSGILSIGTQVMGDIVRSPNLDKNRSAFIEQFHLLYNQWRGIISSLRTSTDSSVRYEFGQDTVQKLIEKIDILFLSFKLG